MISFSKLFCASIRSVLFACLILGSNSFTFAQQDILLEADQMPYFTGCESHKDGTPEKQACSNKNLIRFIANNLVYPTAAKQNKLEGVVYVSFVVNPNGAVESPKIIHDIGGDCGAAAVEVVRSMPPWEPAIHQGEAVSVSLNLPVRFYFKEDATAEEAATYQINWGSLATETISKNELKELAKKPIHVRDAYGNEKAVSELIFAYERKKSYLEESSSGKINSDMKKLIEKCKKGGKFQITAVIQVKNDYIYVKREVEII